MAKARARMTVTIGVEGTRCQREQMYVRRQTCKTGRGRAFGHVCLSLPCGWGVLERSWVRAERQTASGVWCAPIDTIEFDFEFSAEVPTIAPDDGAYTHGLYLEGARMNEQVELDEALPKVLFSPMCVITLKPCVSDQLSVYPHYACPCYRTTERRGVLATTGHSSNFVMFFRIPTQVSEAHWVTRGVALVNSLSD